MNTVKNLSLLCNGKITATKEVFEEIGCPDKEICTDKEEEQENISLGGAGSGTHQMVLLLVRKP